MAIIQPDFKFEDLGIGGLDKEFSAIFRRAFASRIFPPSIVEKLGIQHCKGILLYGPPGTGKTLMARQIGKMLNAREPIIVNGPEILNKYVGQSEENVRKLFAEAEKEVIINDYYFFDDIYLKNKKFYNNKILIKLLILFSIRLEVMKVLYILLFLMNWMLYVSKEVVKMMVLVLVILLLTNY